MMTRSALPEGAGIPKSKVSVSHEPLTVVTASTSHVYGFSNFTLITVPTGSLVSTFIDTTQLEAVLKLREDMLVILPPAHISETLTFTIFATFELELPVVFGFDTMVKDAPSYPVIPEVVDSKSNGKD